MPNAKLMLATLAWMLMAPLAIAHDFGPEVGASAPAFTASDQRGVERPLASLTGERGLVLLITRAADWCPYCQAQIIGLEGVRGEVEAQGWKLAVITTDTVDELARFGARRDISFPLLSDERARIVRDFGLLDPTQPPSSRHNGLPVPTVLFLSPQGIVLAHLGDADYRVRPTPQTVLATLQTLR